MRNEIRIPVFMGQFLFNLINELDIEKDEVDYRWIDSNWTPSIEPEHSKDWRVFDNAAEWEVFRLLRYKTCQFCRLDMYYLPSSPVSSIVFVCKSCFY